MKLLKSAVSIFTASLMCCVFSGNYLETAVAEDKTDISSKVSAHLLEEYGLNAGALKTTQSQKQALRDAGTEKASVLIWCVEDIDYENVERQVLPILTKDIANTNRNSALLTKDDVCLEDILNSDEELSAEAVQKFIETKRAIASEMYTELNGQFVEKYLPDAKIEYISEYSPAVVAELTLGDVIELANLDETSVLECNIKECEPEMDTSIPVVEADIQETNYGYTGNGIIIGQVENYVIDKSLSRFSSISSRIYTNTTTAPALVSSSSHDGNHANMVASIIIGQAVSGSSIPNGIAPGATYYSSSILATSGLLEATEWLVSQGVNVINMSAGFASMHDEYEAYSKWIDHLAIDHDVHFVKSSGNVGKRRYNENGELIGGVSGCGMAYNAIVVGNINDKNTEDLTDDEIHSLSSYSTQPGLAYKPDLCAPGTNIDTVIKTDSGTSFSAPHVTGTVALLCQVKPRLKIQQDVVKAILTAAVNPNSDYKYCPNSWSSNPTTDCYNQYGAGLLDVYESVRIAAQSQYQYGSIMQTESQRTLNMYVTAGTPVRVSLAYLKNNTIASGNHYPSTGTVTNAPLTDLDLYVYTPNGSTLVASSTTSANNVEIVEFTPTLTGTYKIKIKNFDQSIAETTKFGLSWMQ